MGYLTAADILADAEWSLLQSPVFTSATAFIGTGSQTVTPASMLGIYVGAQLIVGANTSCLAGPGTPYGVGIYGYGPYSPTGTQELITVTATTATNFTAVFANTHQIGEAIYGPTFPLGQPDYPLFTQPEMLAYLADVQKDFLLKTRLIYSMQVQNLQPGKYFPQPNQAIRVERISINGNALYTGSQTSLDLMFPTWTTQDQPQIPTTWFLDQANTGRFGLFPPFAAGGNTEIWYSDRGADSLALNSQLLVPDAFAHALRYAVLNRCFSKDGEMRDNERALYCKKRFDLVVAIAVRFMLGVDVAMEKLKPQNDSSFSPMPVHAGNPQ